MKKITLCLTLVVSFWLLVFSSLATADIPKIINYQGKLTDKEGYALNGTYNVTFRFYDAAAGGNLLWTEQHSSISVQKGLFSVILGSTTPFNLNFDKQYYLSIQVGADPEMTPRQQLASAPYAMRAVDADNSISSVFSKFGGNGADGVKLVTSDESWDSTPRQYSNLTIQAGKTIMVNDKIVIIGVSGDCTIDGTINANGQGTLGGIVVNNSQGTHGQRADFCPAATTGDFGEITRSQLPFCLGGAGGAGGGISIYFGAHGGGSGGAGGIGGTTGDGGAAQATPLWKINSLIQGNKNAEIITFLNSFGAGGGAGGGQSTRAGGGGAGGGIIYIEVRGSLNFTGLCTANGNNGANASAVAAGGGGGGGGGCIIIRARKISNQNGTLNVSGGTGGYGNNGGSGGSGASGYGAIFLIN